MSRVDEVSSILSVDVGSSSVRASFYDSSGRAVSDGVKLDHSFHYTPEGAATMEPDALLDLVAKAIDKALASSEECISAVSLSTFWHSVICLDADDQPATPILTWADRRSAEYVPVVAELPREQTGCYPHSSYWPAKLLWLKHEHPEVYTSASRFISPGDHIYLNFFGRLSIGNSMASATGMYDTEKRGWSEGMLDSLSIPVDSLPVVSDEPLAGLVGAWRDRWPTLAEVPWFPAVGDGACSSVGSGCTGSGRVALMIGTSGAMRVVGREVGFDIKDGLWRYRVDDERYISGGALSDGGSLVAWVRRNFRVADDVDKVEERIALMEPDSHGLTFLPLLSGERGPGWSDVSAGVVSGLSMATEPEAVMRAAMEAVALRFALILEKIDGIAGEGAEIVASGGGIAGSPVWAKIIADALGRPVSVSATEEASSRGAALLALEKLGHVDLDDDHWKPEVSRIIEPDFGAHEIYREALERQRRLEGAVSKSGG